MIGYVCKYTPTDILKSFGEETIKIDPSISNFNTSDALMHPNMCFYSKSVLEYLIKNKIDKIVLVNCCDSIRRLYDVLKAQNTFKFIHLIDVPRKDSCCATQLFKNELTRFINHYEHFSGKIFNKDVFKKILKHKNVCKTTPNNSYSINLAILGARCKPSLVKMIESYKVNVCNNFTCTGDNDLKITLNDKDDILLQYANILLKTFPCLRMANLNKRYEVLEENKNNIHGIIYHTIKFCDFYSYEYAKLKNKIQIPLLKIETDYTKQSQGQMKTRIEAFLESLKVHKGSSKTPLKETKKIYNNNLKEKLLVMGIDSGSTSTNAVIMNEVNEIIAYSVVRTGAKSSLGATKAKMEILKKSNLSFNDISYTVSTGYGRISIPFANESVTEITCHAKGANFINPNIRTIIDIGGQDSKAIRIDDMGNVTDFAMNDKCAAGTGKFLEMMAKTLEISIDDMGPLSLNWKEQISISSMCSVFAESEVISLIAEDKELSDIIHGLCDSISNKTLSLVNRIKGKEKFMMTGGVAKNIGVVKTLEEKLGCTLFVPKEPEIIGAIGAAKIALEHMESIHQTPAISHQ